MTSKKFMPNSVSLSLIAASLAVAGAEAVAQPMEVVTVEAAREIIIGNSVTGAPIKQITIKSRVRFDDLDLTTDAGAAALEKRIRDTAKSTCNEIKVDAEAKGSSIETCIRDAIEGGMGQANKVIAEKRAAAKK